MRIGWLTGHTAEHISKGSKEQQAYHYVLDDCAPWVISQFPGKSFAGYFFHVMIKPREKILVINPFYRYQAGTAPA